MQAYITFTKTVDFSVKVSQLETSEQGFHKFSSVSSLECDVNGLEPNVKKELLKTPPRLKIVDSLLLLLRSTSYSHLRHVCSHLSLKGAFIIP